jgi:UDP:flavonoid glycosyltransferase YjiC (YdhE family)/pimeloyl-ACP methyl ester carboxylesterase
MADVVARGLRFHVQRLGGSGPTVVFLHGLVMDNLSSFFFTLASPVAQHARVVLYDLRGHGMSERPKSGYTLDEMVADLEGVLDRIGERQVTLVGNSFGGLLALAFAARFPDRVESLVLIDAHVGRTGWAEKMAATLALEGEARDRQIAISFESWLGRHSRRKSSRLAKHASALVYETSLVSDMRASGSLDDSEIRKVTAPVLALYGENSDLRGDADRLATLLPSCELRIFADSTHSILWEETARVRELVTTWIAERASAAPKNVAPRRAEPKRRFLFVVPPLVGHTNPTVSVAKALDDRGHEVAWVGHPGAVRPLLPEGAKLFELDDRVPESRLLETEARAREVRGLLAFKFLWEEFFLPLARAMIPGVTEAVNAFEPDVLVVDQQALAGAIVARKLGRRWATFSTTSAGLTDPLAGLPQVRGWLDGEIAKLERGAGLDPNAAPDLSPALVIAFSTPELVGGAKVPEQTRFVGPAFAHRPKTTDFPFDELRDVRRVFVSLGTVNPEAGDRFYPIVFEAIRELELQAIVVAPDRFRELAPPNAIVRSFVPQLELLPRMHAVVCHAGHNTVCESLANGLPLVVLPIKDDQPVVAQQVADAGAGLRLKFGRVRASELRDAIVRVLDEPSFGAAADRIRASFERAGGAQHAAELLTQMVNP